MDVQREVGRFLGENGLIAAARQSVEQARGVRLRALAVLEKSADWPLLTEEGQATKIREIDAAFAAVERAALGVVADAEAVAARVEAFGRSEPAFSADDSQALAALAPFVRDDVEGARSGDHVAAMIDSALAASDLVRVRLLVRYTTERARRESDEVARALAERTASAEIHGAAPDVAEFEAVRARARRSFGGGQLGASMRRATEALGDPNRAAALNCAHSLRELAASMRRAIEALSAAERHTALKRQMLAASAAEYQM